MKETLEKRAWSILSSYKQCHFSEVRYLCPNIVHQTLLLYAFEQVARDFMTMFPNSSDGMLRWAVISKKVLKLLNGNKDRTLRKLMDALMPEEEKTSVADNPSGEYINCKCLEMNQDQ
jgi:hypothetical protein